MKYLTKKIKLWKHGIAIWVTQNKTLEIEFVTLSSFSHWFSFLVDWTRKGDHCGFTFEIVLGKFDFELKFYDNRHWNYKEDRFYLDGEEQKKGYNDFEE